MRIRKYKSYEGSKLAKMEAGLEKIATNFGLEYSPAKLQSGWISQMDYPELKGELEGFPFHLKFEGYHVLFPDMIEIKGSMLRPVEPHKSEVFKLQNLNISIELPNPEGSHFFIGNETSLRKLGKLLGQQDILVNNKTFDNRFILQSDRPELLQHLLNKTIQDLLLSVPANTLGKFSFGDRSTLKRVRKPKSKKTDKQDVLDYHLLFEANTNQSNQNLEEDLPSVSKLRYHRNYAVLQDLPNLKYIATYIKAIQELSKQFRIFYT